MNPPCRERRRAVANAASEPTTPANCDVHSGDTDE
jgi:hypothetical protein